MTIRNLPPSHSPSPRLTVDNSSEVADVNDQEDVAGGVGASGGWCVEGRRCLSSDERRVQEGDGCGRRCRRHVGMR